MEKEFFTEQDIYLAELERELGIKDNPNDDKIIIFRNQINEIQIPNLKEISSSNWAELIKEWPTVEYDLFPRWRKADIPVMLTVGFLGAIVSNGLHNNFREWHDNEWSKKSFPQGGHSGEDADSISGYLHRLKYGHDLFNPGQIKWDEYFRNGDIKASLGKKIFAWLRHLFQDSFSTEGLPLPGHSYFKDQISKQILPFMSGNMDLKQAEVYKIFFTIKARDVVGAGLITTAMMLYVYGTERGNKRKFFNYRYVSLTLGALAVCIIFGLLMPAKSFNHPALAAMVGHFVVLYKLNKRINEQLKERDEVLTFNEQALLDNEEMLSSAIETIDINEESLDKVMEQLNEVIKQSSMLLDQCLNEIDVILEDQDAYLDELEKNFA